MTAGIERRSVPAVRILPGRPRVRRLTLEGPRPIWLLTAAIAATALLVFGASTIHLPVVPAPFRIPWWALAVLSYLVEMTALRLDWRRQSNSFSLSEIPFVLGLFFTSPVELVAAQLVGFLAAMLHRRQQPVKLAFNLAQHLLTATLALALFHGLGQPDGSSGPRIWLAAFAAMLLTELLGVALIATAISLAERRVMFAEFRHAARFGGTVCLTDTSLALAAALILWHDPAAIWLLAIPVGTLLIAYRAYLRERQKHESLEFLYESARILHRSPDLDTAVVALLEHARDMFRVEVAAMTLFPSPDVTGGLRTVVGPPGGPDVMRPVQVDPVHPVRARLADGCALLVRATDDGEPRRDRWGRLERDVAMVAALRGEDGLLGILRVSGRERDGKAFDRTDLRLFETLANHVAMALANGQLEHSLEQLHALKDQLRHQALHDSLTGLANRNLFRESVDAALAHHRAGGLAPAVIFVDLDDFKTVNDGLGHAAGDQLLLIVAARVRSAIRPHDLAARLGGDEFGILVQDLPGPSAAVPLAQRLIDEVRAPVALDGREVSIGASVGIAFSRHDEQPEDVLRNADVAMYTAKARGKGRFALFQPSMHAAVLERHELNADLRGALERDEFEVHYQPIVALGSGQVTGFEALVRWRHPARGLLAPADFVPLAEETGAIVPVGRWVLHEACRQGRTWQGTDARTPVDVTVNLSARQVQQPNFVEEVSQALRATGLPPSRLVLEITETLMMQDAHATIEKLQVLRRLGIRVAIDDFGTGYASLGYLRRFPVDLLKIPREFVDVTGDRSAEWGFAEAIVALGRTLGLGIVAEGIERPEQLARIRGMGCESGQGYLFSRPATAPAVEALLTGVGPGPRDAAALAPEALRLASADGGSVRSGR